MSSGIRRILKHDLYVQCMRVVLTKKASSQNYTETTHIKCVGQIVLMGTITGPDDLSKCERFLY